METDCLTMLERVEVTKTQKRIYVLMMIERVGQQTNTIVFFYFGSVGMGGVKNQN